MHREIIESSGSPLEIADDVLLRIDESFLHTPFSVSVSEEGRTDRSSERSNG